MDDIIKDFLVESYENLDQLDRVFVDLEKDPGDQASVSSIFRTIHTIKGTCGFLGLAKLESITHVGENLLSRVRDGVQPFDPDVASALLSLVDAIRAILAHVEKSGQEGDGDYTALTDRLTQLQGLEEAPQPAPALKTFAPPPPSAESSPGPQEEDASGAGSASGTASEKDTQSHSVADSTIRINVELLDKLMNLVGELVLARNQILQHTSALTDPGFIKTSQKLNLITSELQDGVMKTRMQLISNLWNRFPRVVRDLAAHCGKQARLEMEGSETELDRTIVEAIKDPLTHLLRNAIDHGIETPEQREAKGKPAEGCVRLRAFHEGGQVNIEISEDGAGIDLDRVKRKAIERSLISADQAARLSDKEAVNLIFLPGFSTAPKVTNVSGRGVGMDVVKTNIEKIGGTLEVTNQFGYGTSIRMKIPLTLAIIPGLVVTAGDENFVIPQISLVELVRFDCSDGNYPLEEIQGGFVFRRRGVLLPIVFLADFLGLSRTSSPDVLSIVVLQAEACRFGVVVDSIRDSEEIVVKPLGKRLKGLRSYSGATIMGDGRVALILDVAGLAEGAGLVGESAADITKQDATDAAAAERQMLMLFRSGEFERLAVPLTMVERLEQFQGSQLEQAGGQRAIQYRDEILPLIPLGTALGSHFLQELDPDGPVQALIVNDGRRRVGFLIDQVLDIVDEAITAKRRAARRGLCYSAIVDGKITEFVDLPALLEDNAEAAGLFDGDESMSGLTSLTAAIDSYQSAAVLAGEPQ